MNPAEIPPNAPLAPPPPGQVTDFSNPVDHQRYTQFIVTLVVLYPISTICVLLRLYTRGILVKQFGWDDVFALIAMLLNIGLTIEYVGVINSGLADYDWNVRALEYYATDADVYNYWNAVGSLIFYLVYMFVKLSILSLYLRVVGNTSRAFRIAVYFLMFIVCGTIIGFMIAILKFCDPVQKLFHPITVAGTCNVNTSIFFAQAVVSVATDILILIPPVPIIWRLSCSVPRKLGLVAILCLGLVVSAIAMVRAVAWSGNVAYFLYDNYNGVYWAVVEVNFAIIAVCLPALAQLFRRLRQNSSYDSKESPFSPTPQDGASRSDGSTPKNTSSGNRKKRSPTSQVFFGMFSEVGRSAGRSENREEQGPLEMPGDEKDLMRIVEGRHADAASMGRWDSPDTASSERWDIPLRSPQQVARIV